MDRVLRFCALLLLCALGDAWVRHEGGLNPTWDPVWEGTEVRASVCPEGDPTQDPEVTSGPPPDSPGSTNPWTEGQGCGTVRPDSDSEFAYQVFLLMLGVVSFACLGCCCSCFLNWLASYLNCRCKIERIPRTITRRSSPCDYGAFRNTAPVCPDSVDARAVQRLEIPRQNPIVPRRLKLMPVRAELATDLPRKPKTRSRQCPY